VPPWGRPPGARLTRGQRAWAAQSWSEYDDRFEELETDDDGLHGVELDQGYVPKRFASDELRFTGIDMGARSGARRRHPDYYDDDYTPSDEEYDGSTGLVRRSQGQLMLREKEEALVERAQERIRRARALGKTNVKLSRAEIDALDRLERSQNPPPTPPIPMPAPKAAPKGKKAAAPKQKAIESKKTGKSSKSGSNSPKPKSKESRSRGQSVASTRSKGSAKEEALVPYPVSPDEQYAYPPWYGRPGGPNSLHQEARAGSASRMPQREPMPPMPYYHAYNSHPDVIYGPRPGSNSSYASRPDPADPDWEPRARSASSLVNFPLDQLPQQAVAGTGRAPRFDPADPRYASPPTRRVVSGPPRGRPDELFLPDDQEVMQYLTESTTNDEARSTSDSDDSSQGVQVNVEERAGGQYAIQTRAAAQKRIGSGPSKGAAKKRK